MSRIAILIGNSNYPDGNELKNPANDARDMATVLSKLDFEVITLIDSTQKDMMQGILDFIKRIEHYSTSLFYFAGHGFQLDGGNYLLPIDFSATSKASAMLNAYSMNEYMDKISNYSDKINIVILDACRTNPYTREFRDIMTEGFVPFVDAPTGTFIAYSTSPNKGASDGSGDNGLYTGILKQSLQIPNIKIEETFKLVRTQMYDLSAGSQVSWDHSSLMGEFYFSVTAIPSKDFTEEEIYEYIENKTKYYDGQGDLDIYEVECRPYIDAQKYFGMSIIEILRIYMRERHSRNDRFYTDKDLDEINIRYLSSWGFEYKHYRWYFRDDYVVMGDPLPLEEIRKDLKPSEGEAIDVEFHLEGQFIDEALMIKASTNIPDKMKIILSISDKNKNYFAQSIGYSSENKLLFEGLTNKGHSLGDGLYTISLSSGIYSVQPEDVKKKLGESNMNLDGVNVKHSPIGGKTLRANYTCVIKDSDVSFY